MSWNDLQYFQKPLVTRVFFPDFFKEQERRASLSSQEGLDRKPSLTSLSSFDGSPTNTIRRNGSISKAPGIKPKPIPESNGGNVYSTSPRPPPPAPPKRSDSIYNGLSEIHNGTPNGTHLNGTHHNGSVNGSMNGSLNGSINGKFCYISSFSKKGEHCQH